MFLRIGVVSMALVLTAASSAPAQSSATAPPSPLLSETAPAQPLTRSRVGPSVESGIASARRAAVAPSTDAASAVQDSPHVGRNVALMAVGGAAFVVGAIIGDKAGTVFMVGGGVVFLYGLFQYLQ
jgi:hypothetical protein